MFCGFSMVNNGSGLTVLIFVETQKFASLHPSPTQVVPKYFASPGKPFDLRRVCLHYACTMGRTWERLGNVGAGTVLGLGEQFLPNLVLDFNNSTSNC